MSGHSMEGLTNCPVACLTPFNCCKTLSTLRRVADSMQGSRFAESSAGLCSCFLHTTIRGVQNRPMRTLPALGQGQISEHFKESCIRAAAYRRSSASSPVKDYRNLGTPLSASAPRGLLLAVLHRGIPQSHQAPDEPSVAKASSAARSHLIPSTRPPTQPPTKQPASHAPSIH